MCDILLYKEQPKKKNYLLRHQSRQRLNRRQDCRMKTMDNRGTLCVAVHDRKMIIIIIMKNMSYVKMQSCRFNMRRNFKHIFGIER